MASPTFRSKASGGGSAAADVTNNVPSGTADDDILIFALSKDNTNAVTWPGGWNIIVEATQNSFYLGLGWKRASSEPASYTWTFTSVWRDSVMLAYQGAASAAQASNPLDPDTPPAGNSGTGSITSITVPDVTTTTVDTIMLAICNDIAISGWSAAPAGWTQREAGGSEICIDDRAFASAGTQAGAVQGCAFSTGAWKGYSLAIQSVGDDQHYFPPPVFPGVFNLDARRMI